MPRRAVVYIRTDADIAVDYQIAMCVAEYVAAGWDITAWAEGGDDHLESAVHFVEAGGADILLADHPDVIGEQLDDVAERLDDAGAVLHVAVDAPSPVPVPMPEVVARLHEQGLSDEAIAAALGYDVATVRGMIPRRSTPQIPHRRSQFGPRSDTPKQEPVDASWSGSATSPTQEWEVKR